MCQVAVYAVGSHIHQEKLALCFSFRHEIPRRKQQLLLTQ
jgi:hypothetical protein